MQAKNKSEMQIQSNFLELIADGDNQSPQHFEPPQNSFALTAKKGTIDETLPMYNYLNRKEIGSTTLSKLQQSELAMWHEMQRADTESTKAQITGTAIHAYIEARAAGQSVEQYLGGLLIAPNFSRSTTESVITEILYYQNLLGVDYVMPAKINEKRELAEDLRLNCQHRFNFLSANDAAAIIGVANELQRRHDETRLFDWLQYAKSEVSFFMGHFKCRPDLLCDGLIVSIKTCARIERAEQDAKYNYGIKEAFYRHLITEITGKPHRTAMLFFESSAPYQSRLLFVSNETAEYYDQQVEALIEKASRCLASGKFRGYEANLEYGVEII